MLKPRNLDRERRGEVRQIRGALPNAVPKAHGWAFAGVWPPAFSIASPGALGAARRRERTDGSGLRLREAGEAQRAVPPDPHPGCWPCGCCAPAHGEPATGTESAWAGLIRKLQTEQQLGMTQVSRGSHSRKLALLESSSVDSAVWCWHSGPEPAQPRLQGAPTCWGALCWGWGQQEPRHRSERRTWWGTPCPSGRRRGWEKVPAVPPVTARSASVCRSPALPPDVMVLCQVFQLQFLKPLFKRTF